jgi:hypothetical protein
MQKYYAIKYYARKIQAHSDSHPFLMAENQL